MQVGIVGVDHASHLSLQSVHKVALRYDPSVINELVKGRLAHQGWYVTILVTRASQNASPIQLSNPSLDPVRASTQHTRRNYSDRTV